MRLLAGEPGDDTQVRAGQSRTRRVSQPAVRNGAGVADLLIGYVP